jgi:diguanylate cyclase (GGDEF)-like protein
MALFSNRLPTIQARISALVVACVLPAALAASLLLYRDYRMERANVERSTVDTARALSQVIDRELIGAEATLRILSSSPYLRNGDLQSFYQQTQEILQGDPSTVFVLCDVKGKELINTLMPYGSELTTHGNANRFGRISHSAQPVISNLFASEIMQRQLVAVELAVTQGKRAPYILSMEFIPARFGAILDQQRLPQDQVISLLDGAQAIIASTGQPDQPRAIKLDAGVLQEMNHRTEGTIEVDRPHQESALFAFNRSSLSNWTLVIAGPSATILGTLWEAVSLIVVGTLLLLVIGLILAHAIGNRISKSIRNLVAPALALGHGNAVIVPALHLREADDVGQALLKAEKLIQLRTVERDMATQTAQRIHEVKQKFEYQAYHDALTGLANRVLFNEIIKSGIAACASNSESLIVLYIDIDDFKQINDRYGHAVGDEMLSLIAARLKAALRESDVTARLGGDEFAAILLHTNLIHAKATADLLVDLLSRPYVTTNLTLTTSASIGVASYPDSASTAEILLRQADTAMYRAKALGKQRCALYDPSMDKDPDT